MSNWISAILAFVLIVGAIFFFGNTAVVENPTNYLPDADSPEVISAAWSAIHTYTENENFEVVDAVWAVDDKEHVSLLVRVSHSQAEEIWLLRVDIIRGGITAEVAKKIQ